MGVQWILLGIALVGLLVLVATVYFFAQTEALERALKYAEAHSTLAGKIGALAHYDVVKTTEPLTCTDGVSNFTCFLSKTGVEEALGALRRIGVEPEIRELADRRVTVFVYSPGGIASRQFNVSRAWELSWENETVRLYQTAIKRSYGELLKIIERAEELYREGAFSIAPTVDGLVVFTAGRQGEAQRILEAVRRIDPEVNVLVVPIAAPPEPAPNSTIAGGYGRFAVEFYKRVAVGRLGENLVLSPYSVYKAFAMAYAGASGATREELKAVFGFGEDPCVLPAASRGVEEALSAWLQTDFPFKPNYLNKLRCIGAEAKYVDFERDYKSAIAAINKWAEEKTRGLIKDLVPADYPEGWDVCAVLVSALYFKGNWWPDRFQRVGKREFKGAGPADFIALDLSSCGDPSLRGRASSDLTVVELPFNNTEVALYIIMPRDLPSFVKELTYEKLREIISTLPDQVIRVEMPLFKAEFKGSVKQALREMGVVRAFETSDFTEMAYRRLYIDDVFHGAYLNADENGVVAAAATAVVFKPVCAKGGGVEVVVDKPFLFVLADRTSGVIYFIGHVVNPSPGFTPT